MLWGQKGNSHHWRLMLQLIWLISLISDLQQIICQPQIYCASLNQPCYAITSFKKYYLSFSLCLRNNPSQFTTTPTRTRHMCLFPAVMQIIPSFTYVLLSLVLTPYISVLVHPITHYSETIWTPRLYYVI